MIVLKINIMNDFSLNSTSSDNMLTYLMLLVKLKHSYLKN